MKDAATKSYAKKGADIVDMNHKAIDAGATAFVAGGRARGVEDGRSGAKDLPTSMAVPRLVALVTNVMEPVARMDGDSLPVSAFVGYEDGQFPLGASAYEKRGVAVIGA